MPHTRRLPHLIQDQSLARPQSLQIGPAAAEIRGYDREAYPVTQSSKRIPRPDLCQRLPCRTEAGVELTPVEARLDQHTLGLAVRPCRKVRPLQAPPRR